MATPLVSVAMISYNQGQYIGETIASVLAQTMRDFELIIVDNHSTDNTLEVVKGFQDDRIRLCQIHNGGFVGNSRNLANEKSRGKFIAFLDSDDVWYPDKLEKCLNSFSESGVALVYSLKEPIDKEGRPIKLAMEEAIYHPSGWVHEELLWNSFTVPSALVVRREVIDGIGGFSTQYSIGEDHEWLLRASQRFKFFCVNFPLVKYRIHSGGYSLKYEEKGAEILRIYSFYLPRMAQFSSLGRKGVLRHLSYANSLLGRGKAINGAMAEARRFFFASLCYRPQVKNLLLLFLSFCGGRAFRYVLRLAYGNVK